MKQQHARNGTRSICRDCKADVIIYCKGRCKSCADKRKKEIRKLDDKFVTFLASFKSDIFVETGTYGGKGVIAAIKCGFKEIFTVEIYKPVLAIARRNISRHGHLKSKVHLSVGESGSWLPKTVSKISTTESITFWLDAHYSGRGTGKFEKEVSPLRRELDAIKSCNRPYIDTILIDDIKHLGTFKYTIDDLKAHLLSINPNFEITVLGKIVTAVPKGKK